MPWFKVDDSFYDHPKIENLSMAAIGLWAKAGAWCAKHLTDGVISAKRVRALGGTPAQIKALIKNGLWFECKDDSGAKCYAFHDWFDMQPSREQVYEKREIERQKKRKQRANQTGEIAATSRFTKMSPGDRGGDNPGDNPGDSPGLSLVPDPTRPDPNRSADADPKNSQKGAAGFDDFWAVVPRKVGKQAARRAWEKAVKLESPQVIVQKMREYRDDPNRVEEFTKHPSTWLNAGCWDDDPLPPRNQGKKQPNDLDVFLDAFDTRSNRGPAGPLSAEQAPNGVSVPRRNFEALETRTDVVDADGWEEVEDQKNPIDIEDNDIPF